MAQQPLRYLSTLCLIAVVGCNAASDNQRGTPLVYDSAGVRIVRNTGSQWTDRAAWRLGPQPVLEIGVVEGEQPYMLSQIMSVTQLADGSIAIINGASRELRMYDRSGRHLRSIGRQGGGPGELQFPAVLTELPGDSLLVWDLGLGRATVYAQDGTVGRVFGLAYATDEYYRADFSRRFPNGDLLAYAAPFAANRGETQTGSRWSIDALIRYSADGRDPRPIVEVERVPCDPRRDGECSFMAYSALGGFSGHGERIFVTRPDRNEIRVLNADGTLLSKIYGAAPLQPVTERMRTEFADAVVARDPGREQELREYVARASFSEVVPAFSHMIISKDGYIWAREYDVADAVFGYPPLFPPRTEPWQWTVFDPEGVELGQVAVPRNFTVREIGEDYLLGIGRDELDVERVQMYTLEKR